MINLTYDFGQEGYFQTFVKQNSEKLVGHYFFITLTNPVPTTI